MTTLGGVTLSSHLHLIGGESKPPLAYSTRETLGGTLVVQRDPAVFNRQWELVAKNDGAYRMGCYTKAQLDSLRTVAEIMDPVVLDHPDGTYNVIILEFNVEPSEDRELPSSTKTYHGSILLQEV